MTEEPGLQVSVALAQAPPLQLTACAAGWGDRAGPSAGPTLVQTVSQARLMSLLRSQPLPPPLPHLPLPPLGSQWLDRGQSAPVPPRLLPALAAAEGRCRFVLPQHLYWVLKCH